MELPAGTKEIRVTISMSYWGERRSLDLSFGMDGVDGQFFPMTPDQRQLVIMNPTPGEHELLVLNAGVPIIGHIPGLIFEVKTPFLRTIWGMLCLFLAIVLICVVVFRWWSGRLARRNKLLELAVNERTRELSLSNTRLQNTVRQKDRMFSILNHDIVSPLRFIERVARQAADDHEPAGLNTLAYKETFEELSFAATRLHANAQNLLNWVKHQDSGIEPRPSHTVVSLLVDQVMAPLLPQARAKGIQLINEVLLDDVVLIDQDILAIVLSNLLINAVNNTPQGSVRVQLFRSGNGWTMRVEDTGPGFPRAVLKDLRRIQAGAQRTDRPAEQGLKGLGYVIINELMTLIGGRFEASNLPTGGARIDLLFS